MEITNVHSKMHTLILQLSVSELTEDYFNQDVDYSTIEGILSSRDLNRTKKAEELSTVLGIEL